MQIVTIFICVLRLTDMKTYTFKIYYLNKGTWKSVNDANRKEMVFESVDAAKKHIDDIRKEGIHPLCLCHRAVIYKFNGCMITGEGVRY